MIIMDEIIEEQYTELSINIYTNVNNYDDNIEYPFLLNGISLNVEVDDDYNDHHDDDDCSIGKHHLPNLSSIDSFLLD